MCNCKNGVPPIQNLLRLHNISTQLQCVHVLLYFSENQGPGQQCCYDDDGQLVVGPPGGGTVDLYAPTGFTGKGLHFYHDVRPFYYCCKGEFSDCREYYKHRPSDDGSRYVLQPPGIVHALLWSACRFYCVTILLYQNPEITSWLC